MRTTHHVEVGVKGRVVIPAAVRERLGLEVGTVLVAIVDDDAVVLMRRDVARRRLRAQFADTGPDLVGALHALRAEDQPVDGP